MMSCSYQMTLQLSVHLRLHKPECSLQGIDSNYILGDKPRQKDEAAVTWTQNPGIAEDIAIHKPSHKTQVFRSTSVHLAHLDLNLSKRHQMESHMQTCQVVELEPARDVSAQGKQTNRTIGTRAVAQDLLE